MKHGYKSLIEMLLVSLNAVGVFVSFSIPLPSYNLPEFEAEVTEQGLLYASW